MPDTQKDFYKKFLGKKGERLAEEEIKKCGYKLVKRNFTTPYGEADLVFQKGDETIFVEVKTRSGTSFGLPCEAVGYKKQEKYRMIDEHYFRNDGGADGKNISFAVAEVTPAGVNVIYNAF